MHVRVHVSEKERSDFGAAATSKGRRPIERGPHHRRVGAEVPALLDVPELSPRRVECAAQLVEGDARVHVVDGVVVHAPGEPLVRRVGEHHARKCACGVKTPLCEDTSVRVWLRYPAVKKSSSSNK